MDFHKILGNGTLAGNNRLDVWDEGMCKLLASFCKAHPTVSGNKKNAMTLKCEINF